MARIPYPDINTLPEDIRKALSGENTLNIARMMGHAAHLVQPFSRLGLSFLTKGVLDPVTRECAILRVGYLSGASYETAQHEKIGRDLGMDEALFEAVRAGPGAAGLSAEQAEALALVDDVVANAKAGDSTFQPVLARFGPAGAQELVLVTGYYMMVCRFLETFEVDIEPGGPRGLALR